MMNSDKKRAIVAIPAHNEANRIEKCLAALACQRDEIGAPVRRGAFEVLILANNCTDNTVDIAKAFSSRVPHPVTLVEETFPDEKVTAGWARKCAMDHASKLLGPQFPNDAVLLTTDADSTVSQTWFAANMREIDDGADCVAGYIDAEPIEILNLGPAFLTRGRLEDTFLRLVAEIYARCDPRPHDPWPNHRVSSGASLAVRLSAYRAIGGLPPQALGEDIAFTETLDRAGFKVRHSLDVTVSTSCRLDGRTKGGAADTMRHRHEVPDAECDAELEPALQTARRAIYRGLLRKECNNPGCSTKSGRWRMGPQLFGAPYDDVPFFEAWRQLSVLLPDLQPGAKLRPSDLPRQIAIANMVVLHLRHLATSKSAPTETSHPELLIEPEV